MPDRNTYPYSEAFYQEIEEEVQRITNEKNGIHLSDIELILTHLKCLEGSVHQYTGQIKEALIRIEKGNHKEVL